MATKPDIGGARDAIENGSITENVKKKKENICMYVLYLFFVLWKMEEKKEEKNSRKIKYENGLVKNLIYYMNNMIYHYQKWFLIDLVTENVK